MNVSGRDAATWLIDDLEQTVKRIASENSSQEYHIEKMSGTIKWLHRPLSEFFGAHSREAALEINNYYVGLFRKSINWQNANWRSLRDEYMGAYRSQKQLGLASSPEFRFMFRPRRAPSGMKAPLIWMHHYQALFGSNHDAVVSGVLQNVVLGNEPAGERHPWRN